MSRFEVLAFLDEDFTVPYLWKIVRDCNEILERNYDETISFICTVMERLARNRDGEAVDADLARDQDLLIKDLSKRALKGNRNALRELDKFTKNLSNL